MTSLPRASCQWSTSSRSRPQADDVGHWSATFTVRSLWSAQENSIRARSVQST